MKWGNREIINFGIDVTDIVEAKGLRWYGFCVEWWQMPEKGTGTGSTERRIRGRPRRVWKEGIKEAVEPRNLEEN